MFSDAVRYVDQAFVNRESPSSAVQMPLTELLALTSMPFTLKYPLAGYTSCAAASRIRKVKTCDDI